MTKGKTNEVKKISAACLGGAIGCWTGVLCEIKASRDLDKCSAGC
jgi:hypothetical protein